MDNKTFSYSCDASEQYHTKIANKRTIQKTKILLNSKLKEFVMSLLPCQSLKSIGGRSKIAFEEGLIETMITHKTLYNYIGNRNVEFINDSALKRSQKQHYRLKHQGKRQNGISIKERSDKINNRLEFGH
jgi:IS30 family transposase